MSYAMKYTQEGGNIELWVEMLGWEDSGCARLRFVVRDNGYGITGKLSDYFGGLCGDSLPASEEAFDKCATFRACGR